MKNNIQFLFYAVFVFLFWSCSSSDRFKEQRYELLKKPDYIDVLLFSGDILDLSFTFETDLSASKGHLGRIRNKRTLQFSAENNILALTTNGKDISDTEFIIKPIYSESFLTFKGKRYRGLFIIRRSETKVLLVNRLELDDYLRGVLAPEMGARGDASYLEALKTAAICARTFAINNIRRSKLPYHVTNDTRFQVYDGLDAEAELENEAINETKDMLLVYMDKPAEVLYHASCGGATVPADEVFSSSFPYLQSVHDGEPPYCSIAPNFYWEREIRKSDVEKSMKDNGTIYNHESIKSLSIYTRFHSGRIKELKIITDKDRSVIIEQKSIRTILKTRDNKILPSTYFVITHFNKNTNTFTVKGKGHGHGVGLCQWGAIGLSKKGNSFKQILKHYFPGTEIGKLYD